MLMTPMQHLCRSNQAAPVNQAAVFCVSAILSMSSSAQPPSASAAALLGVQRTEPLAAGMWLEGRRRRRRHGCELCYCRQIKLTCWLSFALPGTHVRG